MEITSKSLGVVGNCIEVSKENINFVIYDYYFNVEYSDGMYMVISKK